MTTRSVTRGLSVSVIKPLSSEDVAPRCVDSGAWEVRKLEIQAKKAPKLHEGPRYRWPTLHANTTPITKNMSVNRMRATVKDVFDSGAVVSSSLEFTISGLSVGSGAGTTPSGNKPFTLNHIALK